MQLDASFAGNRMAAATAWAVLGVFLTVITQRFLGRRSLFTYFVRHNRLGVPTDDPVFSAVRVTWNDSPAADLHSSVVELRNESLADFENVTVRTYATNTSLLSERTEIVGTTQSLKFTTEYAKSITVPDGGAVTSAQKELVTRQRDYLIPTFNRGQTVRFTYLNSAIPGAQPDIKLEIQHKGVKVKYRAAQIELLGVSQPFAGFVGVLLGCIFVWVVIAAAPSIQTAAILCYAYGLGAVFPGVALVRAWRKLREAVGG